MGKGGGGGGGGGGFIRDGATNGGNTVIVILQPVERLKIAIKINSYLIFLILICAQLVKKCLTGFVIE